MSLVQTAAWVDFIVMSIETREKEKERTLTSACPAAAGGQEHASNPHRHVTADSAGSH